MMERRASEYETVDESHRHANVDAFSERAQHPTCCRSVQIQIILDPPVRSRDDNRLAVCDEANVTDEGFIKDLVHDRAIVLTALRQALQSCSFGACEGIH